MPVGSLGGAFGPLWVPLGHLLGPLGVTLVVLGPPWGPFWRTLASFGMNLVPYCGKLELRWKFGVLSGGISVFFTVEFPYKTH